MSLENTQLVMTIIGADHPGIVESVSRVVSDHQGNWLASRMARLAGQFAGIVHVEVAPAQAEAMIAALTGLKGAGVDVVVARSTPDAVSSAPRNVQLELTGSDHPGIVHHITEAIAAGGVNIEEFSSEVTPTPMSGQPLFHAEARLQVPATVSLEQLRTALEQVAADMMVDVTISEQEDATG